MPVITDRRQLPDEAKMTADLIEDLGFNWEFQYDRPLSDFVDRVQTRKAEHFTPSSQVSNYRNAMKHGSKFPPIVATKDGCVIDGNTRIAAARKNGMGTFPTLTVTRSWATADKEIQDLITLLGVGFNTRNGKGIDRDELRKAVLRFLGSSDFDVTRLAAKLGVTEGVIRGFLYEEDARTVAKRLGILVNGSMTASLWRALGAARSNNMHDPLFKQLVELVLYAGLTVSEIRELARVIKKIKSDDEALKVLAKEFEKNRDRAMKYKASGKSRPVLAANLRQWLGNVVKHQHQPGALVEHNPGLVEEHVTIIELTISILQEVLELQPTN